MPEGKAGGTKPRHSLGCIRTWPSDEARQWTCELVGNLAAQPKVDALVALGSAVRPVSDAADVDFLIVYHMSKPKFRTPPIDVDIRSYPRAKVHELVSSGHDFLCWAIRLGCVVFERDGYWTRLRETWVERPSLPLLEKTMLRAKQAEEHFRNLTKAGDSDAAEEQRLTMLTHLAWAQLSKAGVYPASRPELPTQLREIAEDELANRLSEALKRRRVAV